MVYNIIEVANTHGGNINYLIKLINSFSEYKKGFGIKFQPFAFNTVATPDYAWYSTYQELFFDQLQWKDIIDLANNTKDVWLDLFDIYGVEILKSNIAKVRGIKFQASVLYNTVLIDDLTLLDLSGKDLIVNISAFKVEDVKEIIEKIQKLLNPKEIYIEIGFQAYPTRLIDSGLNKIKVLKENFTNKIVFADHLEGTSDDAIWLPVIASLQGVDMIEKHVMINREETKYDHFSSLTPELYKKYIERLSGYNNLFNEPFINEREKDYLEKTIMVPTLRDRKSTGSLFNTHADFDYKRSANIGLHAKQIEDFQSSFHILQNNKQAGETIREDDFKRANIAVIIACRLKSSRLPKKALLKIGELSSVELCLKNALKFSEISHTILATSTVEEDAELSNYTYSPAVIFHRGDPVDVIQRYLDIIRTLRIDVVVRVTADCPFIDDEIFQFLLKEHFKTGADYTTARSAAVGTNLEIINSAALEKVKESFPNADYSEYMTWYFQNNPDHFRLNFVDLPKELVRDYRLTLDHQEDLDMFNLIHQNFIDSGHFNYRLRDIFHYLDQHPEIAALNKHLKLKYKTDNKLIEILDRETRIRKSANDITVVTI